MCCCSCLFANKAARIAASVAAEDAVDDAAVPEVLDIAYDQYLIWH